MFHKTIAENFPNIEKVMPLRYKRPPEHQSDTTK
jgi:hypothetical protein